MTTLRNSKPTAWLVAAIVIIIPLVVWSYPSDPPLHKTGAPGERTCADCHSGGQGGGSIAVTSSTGTKYKPGIKQRLTVTITDANAIDWGYEMTAVLTAKPSTGEGKFRAADKNSNVRKSGTKSYPSQINDLYGSKSKVTYLVDWTPPATNVGKITLYLAGVGGTGDPAADSVYKNKLTLSPQ